MCDSASGKKDCMLPRDLGRLKLSLFLTGAGSGLFLYLLPLYVRALGGNAVDVGIVLAVQAALAALSTSLVGLVADRVGRRLVMRVAALVALPGVAFWIVAPRWEWLIPGAVLYGLSVAGFPAMVAYLSRADDEHVGLFGSVFAYFSLGTIVTPIIGGLIAAQLHSMRPVFALSFVLLAASALTLWDVSPEHRAPHSPGAGGLRALAANRRFVLIVGFHAALLCVMSMTTSYLGPYLQDRDHAGDATVGLLGSCVSLGEFMVGLSLGRLSGRVGRLGAILTLQAALAVSLIALLTVHLTPLLVGPFLLRGVILTASILLFAVVGGTLPSAHRGAGFGIMESSYQVGTMVGASVGGLLYAGGPSRPFQVSLVLLGATMALSALMRPVIAERHSEVAV